jgi:predicted enzyme related to lactoylglutathione lyase
MAKLLVNIDVDDIERALRFYSEAFDLKVGRRLGNDFVELVGAEAPLYLLLKREGTPPFQGATVSRTYQRHWSPVHLDLVVPDIKLAIERALSAGATLEQEPEEEPYGLLALLSDPFGNGFCFLQFTGRGYDEIAAPS